VAPTLEPFGKALREVSGRLEERINDIGGVAQELREWQGLSADAQARLEGTLRTQSEMLDGARARYESLATQVQTLQGQVLQARDDTLAVVGEQGEVLTAHSHLLQAQADALAAQRHAIRELSEAITGMTRKLQDDRSGMARSVTELSALISSTRADITASEKKIAQLQSQGNG
jgi:chromosome segregation ATPase